MKFSEFERRLFKESGLILLIAIGFIIWDVKFRNRE